MSLSVSVRTVSATVELGALTDSDITVQALHGPIDSEGRFVNHPAIVPLRHTGGRTWTAEYSIGEAGPYGVTVRAMPLHAHLVHPVELGTIAWAQHL
jgi:starch phosphorylase